jgi:hypothetical protein
MADPSRNSIILSPRLSNEGSPRGISPTFYLIIYPKFAAGNPKNACRIQGFAKVLSASAHFFVHLQTMAVQRCKLA